MRYKRRPYEVEAEPADICERGDCWLNADYGYHIHIGKGVYHAMYGQMVVTHPDNRVEIMHRKQFEREFEAVQEFLDR